MPVFGGWLRNIEDEGMEASWDYVRRLTLRSEEMGWDLSLIAELNLNDIKGIEEPALDAWSTAAALAAVTSSLELMVAVRPNFHQPALFAKQAANIDNISGGRLALNVVSSWWADEATQYGLQFDQHDDRYARTSEWLKVVDGLWTEKRSASKASATSSRRRSASRSRSRARARPSMQAARARRQDDDRHPVRRLCDARRSGGGDPPEDRRHGARRERAGARRCNTAWPPSRSSATARRKRSAS
jgi:FMNH2-dependent dimethyl sulfone monooxygenase